MNSSPIEEIMAHLGAALIQVTPRDDAIIVQHIRDAHQIARAEARRQRAAHAERAIHHCHQHLVCPAPRSLSKKDRDND